MKKNLPSEKTRNWRQEPRDIGHITIDILPEIFIPIFSVFKKNICKPINPHSKKKSNKHQFLNRQVLFGKIRQKIVKFSKKRRRLFQFWAGKKRKKLKKLPTNFQSWNFWSEISVLSWFRDGHLVRGTTNFKRYHRLLPPSFVIYTGSQYVIGSLSLYYETCFFFETIF